jgi:hypothetical protein
MKTRRTRKEYRNAWLQCLIELKKQLDQNRMIQSSVILESFNVHNATFKWLKKIGVVVEHHDNGHIWIGRNPDFDMIKMLETLRRMEQKEYNIRKQSEDFTRKKPIAYKKGTKKPKAIQPEMIFESTNETKKIHKPLTAEDVKDRKQLITYCKTPKKQPESRKFELSLLGFRIFTLIY